ncbi:MAG: protein kinase [Candidatus Sulfotelmatobacter sp.]
MVLTSGTKLGPYEIQSPLGAGGMGEVYRARDTKLNRDVALKVLPEVLAHDPERLTRFKREAQILAALNHSNIATIYGFQESDGVCALAMELVEGQTLAEVVGSGHGVPLQDALPMAKQMADALEYAHERGIIHRDLKPANIKITPEGTVKVLDFGLAKALGVDAPSSSNISNSPTLTVAATQAGMIVGTAAYMGPEQARGKTVDRRADIWSFGCVLYEVLSGRRPFEGETVTDVLASVVKVEPNWNVLPGHTPPRIRELTRRCLTKDLKQRLQAIGEARIVIEETIAGVSGDAVLSSVGSPEPRGLPHRILPWAIGGLLAAALITFVLLWNFAVSAPRQSPVLSYIPPPPGKTFRDVGFSAGPVAVSPDGTQLAFSATDENGITGLYVRPLASDQARDIAGTTDAAAPFWSPDGGSLGFFAAQKLKIVNLANGNVQVLADASCPDDGGSWSPSGTILFTPSCVGPLHEIPYSGGNPTAATKLESDETGHGSPAFLPDGRRFLYGSHNVGDPIAIWAGSVGSNEHMLVLKGARSPKFAFGHLLFIRDSRVFAQSFDRSTGKLAGEATALVDAQSYSVSSGGVLAYQGGTLQGRLQWFDRSGNSLGSVGPVAVYDSVKISPDGKNILAEVQDPQSNTSDLWSYPASGGVGTRLTFSPGIKEFAVWSPDGKYIAYTCLPDGKSGICRKPGDGSGTEERLATLGSDSRDAALVDWSPDGRYLSLNEKLAGALRTEDLIFPLFGDRNSFPAAAVGADQYDGKFSPDGRWFAYFSYESGRPEVYVVPFPGPGGKFQISQNGGWNVQWDKKGHLYFLTMGNLLMQADLATSGNSLQVKALHPLFQATLPSFRDPFFDVSADGSRFLVVTSADPNASRSIGLLLNWESKLKGNAR